MPHPLLGLGLHLGFGLFFSGLGIWSVKTGRMPTRGGFITQEESPTAFTAGVWGCWLMTAVMLAAAAGELWTIFAS